MIHSSRLYTFFLIFLLGLTLVGCNASPRKAGLGKMAPDFTLDDVNGSPLQLSHYRGKVVLLRFWEWCPKCKLELVEVELAYRKLVTQGFIVIAIYVKPTEKTFVRQIAQELKLTYPVLIDKEGEIASQYGVTRFPTNFIIDRRGIIREKLFGEGMNRKELSNLTTPYFSLGTSGIH